ncbi:MAG: hypothetical protein SFY66_12450 [Oculatellaceae cyanobacterium bins.114]|nr:hypothetical protein [Oculatellaceae cyanobacterium bins.114]
MSVDYDLCVTSSKATFGQTDYNPAIFLRGGLIGLVATLAIACQPSPQSVSSSPSIEPTPRAIRTPEPIAPTAQATPSNPTSYINDQLGFQFAYPQNFLLKSSEDTSKAAVEEDLKITLDLWEREQYKTIEAGNYAGGTELPPNVQVEVYRNGDRLSLQDWVTQSDRFVMRGEFQTQAIAGQEALVFQSEGLYSYNNVVLPNQTGDEVIVISLAQINVPELDGPNQKAFEQIVSTFQFNQ